MGFNWDLFNQKGWGVFGKEVCIFNWASQARKNVWERLLLKDFEMISLDVAERGLLAQISLITISSVG